MNKTELLDRLARSGEERLLLGRVLDKLELTRSRSIPAATSFLSPQERAVVEALLNVTPHPDHLFFGGFECAERTLCAFLPDWLDAESWRESEDCPICAIRCTFRTQDRPSHRDFLGSILGLGVTREKLGDFLVGDDRCDLLLLRELRPYLLQNLESAGRTRLKLQPIPLSAIAPPERKVQLIHDTVATLRLDAVCASAFSLSRGRAAELIASGKVQLNYRECLKGDHSVAQGDILSCRGLGKCSVKTVGGLSKKGRQIIELERYL